MNPDNHYSKSQKEHPDKKSGKNPKGGLNEKGRKSYERENPEATLRHHQRRLEIPAGHPFAPE